MNKEMCEISYRKQDISNEALKKFYKSLDKHFATVGIHKKEGEKVINVHNGKPFTMIKNACIQEFGNTWTVPRDIRFKSPYTGKWFTFKQGWKIIIPPRVFIRIFTDKRLQKGLTAEIKQVIQQNAYKDPKFVYSEIGDYARLTMKSRFLTKNEWKKNSETTIRYKGSNDPLYLTGQMMNSITSEVH